MRRTALSAAALAFSLWTGAAWGAGHAAPFAEFASEKAAEAEQLKTTVVKGEDGWLFFAPELRSLGIGEFWGQKAAQVSKAADLAYADPLPAILDFNRQLKEASIRLIVVPAPAKAAVYPDKLSAQFPFKKEKEADSAPMERFDANAARFYELLRENGVEVLDLTPVFWKARVEAKPTDPPLYCLQDTHWSGRACELAAQAIAKAVGEPSWLAQVEKRAYEAQERETQIEGDLWKALGGASIPKETLRLKHVNAGVWRESPVLLLGDSHCLVFHDGGDMHAKGAGLADHLAARLGFPVDLLGVRGSGATPSRIALFRRRDNLKGKRVAVWCFSVREFTESAQGWRKVPVIRP